ncbi:enoyl-[acyl-carrier-protein] reductase FabK [Oscillospiraceae bacterium MB08-C2-2]|nr:enoyl-[acyl-carrier-protein] reductase FabK [Oscillospiraceae bacterium MB08-C2-2]
METRLTRLLGITYPVIQGGMAWTSNGMLAAAVSQAGGLGLIGAASAPPEVVESEILKAKRLTDRPFGVNIMLKSPFADDIAQICIKQKVAVVTTGAGNPGKYIEQWKAAGIRVMPVVPTPALAQRMERAGADAVVAEGCEAGGHIGEMTTMNLVPQVADAVSIPVVAAGGIADHRGFAAALMLGADGVQMGTAFLCAQECPADLAYKQMVIEAKGSDTVVTGRSIGLPVRSLRNKFTRRLLQMEEERLSKEEIEEAALGSLRRAAMEGDLETGSFMAGQSAGLVCEIRSAQAIIEELMESTVRYLGSYTQGRGMTIE